jgi:hypothetical protein
MTNTLTRTESVESYEDLCLTICWDEETPGKFEMYEGELRKVINENRFGWWRYNSHYDRDGYCDNPARGY